MKATCTYENIKTALHAVEFATSKSATLSILNNILIETDGSQLCFSATNLEIGIVKKIQAKIDCPGKIVVSASLLSSFLTALRGNEHVVLMAEGNILTVESGAHRARINGYNVDDFPIIPQMSGKQQIIELDLMQLKENIAKVLHFTSKTETRVELSGVLMSFDEDVICTVATDSFRLGERSVPTAQMILNGSIDFILKDQKKQIILPQQLCAYINKLSDNHQKISFSIEENHLFFIYDDLSVTARLIDGVYPDYKQIIPLNAITTVYVKKDVLIEAMRVTTVFTGKESGEIHFDVKKDTLKIVTQHQELGENMTELHIDMFGEEQKFVLNPRFVIDGVGRIDDEFVEIMINNNSAPVMFRGKDKEKQEQYTYIVMPVKST